MKHDKGPLARKATKGPGLHFFAVSPEKETQVVVGLLHGYADYGERYAHVADVWAERGIASVEDEVLDALSPNERASLRRLLAKSIEGAPVGTRA